MSNTQMLLVAGYPDVEVAAAEFRGLAARVGAKELTSGRIPIQAVIAAVEADAAEADGEGD